MAAGKRADVVVAGAGPVGLFTALALARAGVEIRVVDTGMWPCRRSYALGLHGATVELLERFGLGQVVKENSFAVAGVSFCDRTGVRVQAEAGEMRVLRQDTLEAVLEAALAGLGVKVEWRSELSDLRPVEGGLELTLSRFEKESRGYAVAHTEWVVAGRERVETGFVIGADGHNSKVRRSAGLEFPEVAPAQYAAVFEFECDMEWTDGRIVFGERTTDMCWPLGGGRGRWSFQLPDYQDVAAEALQAGLQAGGFGYFPFERPKEREEGGGVAAALPATRLPELLAERAPWFQHRIGQVQWRTLVRFERRLAAPFVKGRVLLAGDAAHVTAPMGMQSMNLGLQEGYAYAELLGRVLQGEQRSEALAAVGAGWRAEWLRLLGVERRLEAGTGADAWLAGYKDRVVACLPGYGAKLEQMAGELGMAFSLSAGR